MRGARLRDKQRRQDDRHHSDRNVHQEHRSPADRVHQRATDHRSQREADPEHRAPDADRASALARVDEHVADDRHRDRVEHRAADRLQHSRRDQQLETRRQSAQQRAERERRQADLKDAPATDPVGGRSGQHQQAREHERVGVDRPLQARQRRGEGSVDRGQRDVDDRRVEPDDQQAHRADGENHKPFAAVRDRLRRGCVVLGHDYLG